MAVWFTGECLICAGLVFRFMARHASGVSRSPSDPIIFGLLCMCVARGAAGPVYRCYETIVA